MNIIRAAPVAS